MSWLEFVVLGLACFRVTRLIIEDSITDPLRERTIYRLSDNGIGGWVKDLFDCPWCIGFWVCVVCVVMWLAFDRVTFWLAVPFAWSTIVGITAKHLDTPG